VNVEYHHFWSGSLNQEMEFKIYGHAGKLILVFPAQGGRFYEFEDFGMVEAAHWFIDEGKIRLVTPDSIDSQSWANWNTHPADRARRHQDYDRYICQELIPWAKKHFESDEKWLTTGVSMGAYHCANFFFRHPDLFDGTISLSGIMQLHMFVGDYMDDTVYVNSPLQYLPSLEDPWYLDQYRQSQIIICVGQGAWEEPMLSDARALQAILEQKKIPAWFDYWGYDVNHDWPWWRKMWPYFLSIVTEYNKKT
jgi:esterase/lipase superfamily enzyme